MTYKAVIGLEIHAELNTKTKMYCSCKNSFGDNPNTNICPVCTGLPGALPVINRAAVERAVFAGLAFNCRINKFTRMYRKQYFYPDLPKGYQISQFDMPLCEDGIIYYFSGDELKSAGVKQVHIEEDAGKLIHGGDRTYIDYNRCGVPLIEIVTRPDIYSAIDAQAFLETVRRMLLFLGISDCNMQEGSLRCDVNISVSDTRNFCNSERVEIKNLNTFGGVRRAIEFEIKRQTGLLESGAVISLETRGWDEKRQISVLLRSKEDIEDYRYLPEPDIPAIRIDDRFIDNLRNRLPEFEYQKRIRYTKEYNLSGYDAGLISGNQGLAVFFDKCAKLGANPVECAKLLTGEVLRLENETGISVMESKLKPEDICAVLSALKAGKINHGTAKTITRTLFESGGSAADLLLSPAFSRIDDETYILKTAAETLDENPGALKDYISGKQNARTFLIGQCMRKTKGRANPRVLSRILDGELRKRKAEKE